MTLPAQLGVNEPQLIPASVMVSMYLVFGAFIEFIFFLSSSIFSAYSQPLGGGISFLLSISPIQYAITLATGVTILITNHSRFLSKRRLSIAAYMLIFSSILVPLTLYYTPLSLLFTFSLEYIGLSQVFVVLYYNFLVELLILIFVIYPFLMIGREIFPKGGRQLLFSGFLLFLASALIDVVAGTISEVSKLLGNISGSYESFILSSLPVLLTIVSFILIEAPFVKHMKNPAGSGSQNQTAVP